ncbi:MAG: cyclic nucleotide-binding domain-containing protein [Candidatus Margulisiibacteriota bacterium]|jgi:CRP-like cAMP-binding protein
MNTLWNYIFSKKSVNLVLLLKRSLLFRNFNRKELLILLKFMHLRKYQSNELLFSEKKQSNGIYFVKSGKVKIINKNKEIAILKTGEFFNELNILDDPIDCTTALSSEDSEILVLFKVDLLRLINKRSKLAIKFLINLNHITKERLKLTYEELLKTKHEPK